MLSLLLFVAAVPVQFEDLDALDEDIQLQAHAEPIDKRLKLAKCPNDPIIAPAVGDVVVVRCPALGWRLRVPLRGQTATEQRAEHVIRKGDMIECVTVGTGFAVSTQMIALDDAAQGQTLRVKSLTSSTPMTAVAKSRGLATF